MSSRTLLTTAAAAVVLAACAPESEPEPAAASSQPEPAPAPAPAPQDTQDAQAGEGMPDRIVAERGGFIPEGIEYDQANERFLVGSLAEGTIFEIDADGMLTPVVEDDALQSSVGIEVDEPRDRLLVANSDSAVFQGATPGQAMLGVFDLTTGERLAMVDLTDVLDAPGEDAVYFANDVAVGDDGTAYVTDTRMNVVYAVGPDYEASLLHRFEPMEGLALNGIEYHPDGYLIVVGGENLYKVPLDDTSATAQIELPEPIPGADGIVWVERGERLAVVSNADSRVVALTSNDGWASAEVAGMATFEGQGTTAAVAGGDVYVVQPHFADQDPPTIVRVML